MNTDHKVLRIRNVLMYSSTCAGKYAAALFVHQCTESVILIDTLPRCDSLLDSRFIALSKPRPDGQPNGIRPIAVKVVSPRLLSLYALASCLLSALSWHPCN